MAIHFVFKGCTKSTIARTTAVHRRKLHLTVNPPFAIGHSTGLYSTRYSSTKSSRQSDNNGSSSKNSAIVGTIPVGGQGVALHQMAELERFFTQNQVEAFGQLVGDTNPLHVLESNSQELYNHPLLDNVKDKNENQKRIVHGMLVASLFSSIFGTLIPGAVYLEQSLQFVRPVHVGEPVLARVTITDLDETPKRPITKGIVLTCDTTVTRQKNKVCVKGAAKVWLVNGTVQPG